MIIYMEGKLRLFEIKKVITITPKHITPLQ